MGQTRSNLERQLEQARKRRDASEKAFSTKGITDKALKKQPQWREANARCRQLTRRINAVAAIEKQNAELIERKNGASEE